jgi:hypothetical protein
MKTGNALSLALVVSFVAACGPKPDSPGECTDLVNGGTVVAKTTHAEPPPVMSGGTIPEGTYFLTAMDKYNGRSGHNTHRETWHFSGNHVEAISENSLTPGVVMRASGTYTTSGNRFTVHITCPKASEVVKTYTATATQLLTMPSDDPNEVHTYTKAH